MTPDDLTPHALALVASLKKRLPQEIAARLKCSKKVRRHGNVSTVFLFNVWDKNQSGMFDPKYFCYCLGYDPQHRYSPSTWYLHLWVNTIRIYQYSRQIRAALEDIVRHQCPKSFHLEINEQAVNAVIRCTDFSGELDAFESFFLPLYEELIGSIYPYLMPIIDSFTYDLTSEQRVEVINSRKKYTLGLDAVLVLKKSGSIPALFQNPGVKKF